MIIHYRAKVFTSRNKHSIERIWGPYNLENRHYACRTPELSAEQKFTRES